MIRLDIRYATPNNFTGSVFDNESKALMQRPAAEAVARASAALALAAVLFGLRIGFRQKVVHLHLGLLLVLSKRSGHERDGIYVADQRNALQIDVNIQIGAIVIGADADGGDVL
jgi:hypothetical protein